MTAHDITHNVDVPFHPSAAGERFDAAGTASPVFLSSKPMILPTSTGGMADAVSTDFQNGASPGQTGIGFGLYACGHRCIFETSALPADGTVWGRRRRRSTAGADPGPPVRRVSPVAVTTSARHRSN
jgi:hypothetical protein